VLADLVDRVADLVDRVAEQPLLARGGAATAPISSNAWCRSPRAARRQLRVLSYQAIDD